MKQPGLEATSLMVFGANSSITWYLHRLRINGDLQDSILRILLMVLGKYLVLGYLVSQG